MSENYDDPYSYNYTTTKIKSGNTHEINSAPVKNFNVFNPNKVQKESNNQTSKFNEENPEKNQNDKRNQEYNFDGLQGTIDLDKNTYDKPKDNKIDENDYDEEIPLLEGKFYLSYLKINRIGDMSD